MRKSHPVAARHFPPQYFFFCTGCSQPCARPNSWFHGTFWLQNAVQEPPAGSAAKYCWCLGAGGGGYKLTACERWCTSACAAVGDQGFPSAGTRGCPRCLNGHLTRCHPQSTLGHRVRQIQTRKGSWTKVLCRGPASPSYAFWPRDPCGRLSANAPRC